MNDVSFDAVTRRGSLVALGAAGLAAAFGGPMAADAKQSTSKKAKKKCKQQVGKCTTAITTLCAGDPDCVVSVSCCSLLATCDVSAFLLCII